MLQGDEFKVKMANKAAVAVESKNGELSGGDGAAQGDEVER